MSLEVVIAGAGLMGRWHAPFAAQAGATIAAIVDPSERARSALARRHRGARAFERLGDALAKGRAVHVCAPTSSHAALVNGALEAGCHVLVEKPLAPGVAETRELLEEARARGLQLVPVHQFPFQAGIGKLRARRERLGDLVRIELSMSSAGGEGRSPSERRSIMREMLPHAVSLARTFLGTAGPASSWTVLRATADELELHRDTGEAPMLVLISLRGRPTQNALTIVGTRATAQADLFHGFAVLDAATVSRTTKALAPFRQGSRLLATAGGNLVGRAVRNAPAYPGLAELIAAFQAAIASGGRPPVSPDEALEAAALMERVPAR
ncbi:MAG: Gfo/Idh/MocA family oxidoreductase [Acidobacteriota bacterium]